MNCIYWAGDSTAAFNSVQTYPQTGISQVFRLYLKEGYSVVSCAVNGRSTKSFIDEGRLDRIAGLIGRGDFLFIQFGHNDEKENDPSRYAAPFSAYKTNLLNFIDVARAHQSVPILITPLERRKYNTEQTVIDDDAPTCADSEATARSTAAPKSCTPRIIPTHGDYPQAMLDTAAAAGVLCIDLNRKSRELMNRLGPECTRDLFLHISAGDIRYPAFPEGRSDNSHLQYHGAVVFAGLIAEELKKEYPEMII